MKDGGGHGWRVGRRNGRRGSLEVIPDVQVSLPAQFALAFHGHLYERCGERILGAVCAEGDELPGIAACEQLSVTPRHGELAVGNCREGQIIRPGGLKANP